MFHIIVTGAYFVPFSRRAIFAKFSHYVYLTHTLSGFPLKFATVVGLKNQNAAPTEHQKV